MQWFTRAPNRVLTGVTVAALCLASAAVGRADTQVYQSLLQSTGLLEVPHPEGSVTYGTCSVVDRPRGLALTSQHVIGDAAEAVVYFPAYRDGGAITELDYYHQQVAAVRGRVVHREVGRDLALLQLDAVPDHVTAIPLAAQSAGPGDTVHSIGNSGVGKGRLWRYTGGEVRSVYRGRIRSADGLTEARLVETQSPINPGDSGGPLVNDGGELVGVVKSMDEKSSLVSFNVDVSEVKAFLGVASWNQVRPFVDAVLGLKPVPAADAADTDRKTPPVQGSWNVTLINREGEQQSGECRFEADGTFTLTTHADAGPRTRVGRYSYANGVLLMAGDRKVRETLHWVKDRRFTLLADEMLIFDRPAAETAAASPVPNAPAIENSPRPTEKAIGPRSPIGDQLLENAFGRHSPGGPVPPAEDPSASWFPLITLFGAMCVFVLLVVWAWSHGKST